MKKPKLILICGCSGCGKSTISDMINEKLSPKLKVSIVCIDSFYKNSGDIPKLNGNLNYDHPNSFDWKKINADMQNILLNKPTKINVYDYSTHSYFKDKFYDVKNSDVIIFEGIYTLENEELNSLADLKIFVETEPDECLSRRLLRDTKNRGRTLDSVLEQWREVVKPMYKQFISHLRTNADIIIPWKNTNNVSIQIINEGIKGMFNEKK